MFCNFCGGQIPDSSMFCSYCGKKLNDIVSNSTDDENSSLNEAIQFNPQDARKGISIYLNTLRYLEFIIAKLESQILTLSTELETKKNNLGYKSYYHQSILNNNVDGVTFPGNQYITDRGFKTGVYYCFLYKPDQPCFQFYLTFERTMSDFMLHNAPVKKIEEWERNERLVSVTYADRITIDGDCSLFTNEVTVQRKGIFNRTVTMENTGSIWNTRNRDGRHAFAKPAEARELWIKDYQDFRSTFDETYNRDSVFIKETTDKINVLRAELQSAKTFLEKEYNLNVIPPQFRNIKPIFYICDYYDSTNESLSNILFHCDLDEIKSKLDDVIANQRDIITGQAKIIAQNEVIVSQNSAMLNKLSDISKKTESIAQSSYNAELAAMDSAAWAQAAANNTEICAWIALTDYIS